jgi:hypothetical protein
MLSILTFALNLDHYDVRDAQCSRPFWFAVLSPALVRLLHSVIHDICITYVVLRC